MNIFKSDRTHNTATMDADSTSASNQSSQSSSSSSSSTQSTTTRHDPTTASTVHQKKSRKKERYGYSIKPKFQLPLILTAIVPTFVVDNHRYC